MAILDDATQKVDEAYGDASNKVGLLDIAPPPEAKYVAPTNTDLQATGMGIKDASSYLKPDTSVASQLSKILSQDSDYMKQVDAKSKITASSLGMLSSDRYIGAATGAAIREAMPIATADAATAGRFGLQQQQADLGLSQTSMEGLVSGSLKNQEGAIQQQTLKTQGQIEAFMKNAADVSGMQNTNLTINLQTEANAALKTLENNLSQSLMTAEYTHQKAENTRQQATSQVENTMITIENLLKDPDVLQLGSEAVSQIINNQIAMMKSSVELTYNLAKINVDGYVSDLLDTFSDDYLWDSIDTNA